MNHLNYNLTREQVSELLWISTRTLDRYIKKWVFSYKKISNRIYLSKEEVDNFQQNNETIQKNTPQSEIISWWNTTNITTNSIKEKYTSNEGMEDIKTSIKENFTKFFEIIKQKDQLIFDMQNHINDLENKLRNSIALPDYTQEREKILINKEKLEIEKQNLMDELNNEKIKNIIYLILVIWIVLLILFNFF